MKKAEKTQTELLQEFCLAHIGEHYNSPLLDDAPTDWDNHWPIVDADGLLTGDVYETGEPAADGYANVGDMAMVPIASLPATERNRITKARRAGLWDGYANL